MVVFISMLRGINVSGQKKIKMNELKALYESLGFHQVLTYIQSGNIIFYSSISDTSEIKELITTQIEKKYGYTVDVILRTQEELEKIVKNSPFSKKDLSKVLVTFLSEDKSDYPYEELSFAKKSEEEFQIQGKEIHLYLPYGSGRTKLNNNFFEKKLNVTATTRNWRTINKILEMSLSY